MISTAAALLLGVLVTLDTTPAQAQTPPTLSSATVNGASLVLTYNEALDTGSTPAASAYTVTVAGSQRTVSSVAVSGSAVTLTLSSAVTDGQAVTVSYTVPNTNPVQDTGGDDAAALSDQTVTNNTPDTTAPALTTATVNGASLVLTYDEALDTGSTPAASDYTVTVAGSQRTVSSVAVSGSAVTLTLSSAVTDGQAVTVSYTAGTNPVQDAAGNDAAALSDQTVTNNTSDTTAPTLTTATVNGASLVLTYDEALDTGSTPAASDYTVTVAGSQRTVSSVAVSGSAVTLTLSSAVTDGQAVTVSYTAGTNPVQDAAGNDAAALSDQTVTNNTSDTTAPTLTTATVNGASLVLTYDEALDTGSTPAASDYTVTVAGSQRTVSSVTVSGSAVTLTLSSAVTDGQAVTVSYTAGTDPVQDAAGNDAAALSDQTVTNNTSDTTAPTLTTATVNGASLVLTYDEALDTGSTPAASDYTVTVAGSQRTVSSVAVSGSAVTLTLSPAVTDGQAVTVSYTAGTDPVQDAAGNDAAALSDQTVTNNTPDTTAPALTTATVNGASLVLTYDEALDTGSTPAASDYTVTVAGSQRTVSSVAVSGSAVTLTLSSAVTDGQAVTVSYTAGTNPVQDAAGNDAAALSDQTVTNNTSDTTAPTLTTATVNGASLVLTYDEALDTGSTPAASDYTVTVAGSQRTVSSVTVSGSAVTLTLSSAVTDGEAVTVSYAAGTDPVQDAAGNDAAALSDQTVTNNTPDTTAPTLTTATVNGASLVLTYDEALDTGSTPATSDYTVTVAGSQRTVSSVTVSGSAVTLTLSSAVTDGQAVTVSYTAGTNPVQDAAGNDAAALSNQTVTNNTPDTTAPTLTTATVNGASLVLTYDEALDTGSTPATSDYTVTVAGSQRTVSSVAVSGSAVTLTLSSAVTDGQAVTVSYTAGTNPVQDAAGNDAAALSDQTVTNNTSDTTAPTLTTATVNGASLVLTYDEALDTGSTPAASDYTVTVAGSQRTVSSVAVSGSAVTLTLSSAVTDGQAVTVSYTAGTNPVQDAAGNDAAALSDQTVTNNTPDTTAPTLTTATVNGASLVLTYDEALDTGSTPAASDYTVTVAGSPRTVSSVAVSGSAVTLTLSSAVTDGQAVTVSYTAGTNPVQDAAGNDAAALSDQTVTNNTSDTTAPTLTTATVNGASLVLTYDEALDTGSTPATSDYTVTVAGSQRTVSSVTVSGSAVTLTLSSAVTDGQAVTVSYTAGTNPVQDAAGNDAAALSNQTVTNNTPDTTAPTLTTATVNGASLVLTYDEALDTGSTPVTSDYTVTVAGSQRRVSSVTVSGSAVTLTLSSSVTDGEAVTVSYTAGTNPVQDAAGNDAAALSNQTVTNNTPDTTAPALTTATVNGASLVLTYNEALDTGSTPATSAYTVTVAGSQPTVSVVAIGGTAVTLTLSPPVTAGQAARVSYTVPGTNPVQDAAGNDAAALSDQIVTNNTSDTTAPTLTTAAVNGASLVLTYNEALDTTSAPAASDYTVTVAGSQRTVSVVAIRGSAVTLTLSSAVTDGQAVTVSYTAGTNPVRDAARNDAAALSDQTVTNNTPDTTAPALTTATVNGASLVLTYNEALDTGSTPATSDYTVTVAGSQRRVSSVTVSGSAVTLTLSSSVTDGEAVTVSYTAGTNPVQDAAGNDAAALSDQTVTNNTPDTTAPALTTATVNGASLVLTYNEALDTGSTPATSAYTVTVAGSQPTVSVVAIGGTAVTLTLSPPVTAGQAARVSYTVPGTNPVQDAAGNDAAALSDQTVTNNTPDTTAPTLTRAAVNGASLVLTYNEALDTTSAPAASDYTVTVAGSQRTVSVVAIRGSAVTLTLSPPVTAGQAVTVSYTVPGTNPVQDAAGNDAAALSNQTVTNNTPDTNNTTNTPDTTAPTLTTAAVNAASLVLTYDEALDTDSTPGRIAYTVTVAGSQRDIVAVAIGGSAVTLTLSPPVTDGQAVTVSYTVPLTNPVQDAAGNDAAALSDQTVTNNTPDTTAPTLTTAAVNAASLVLTYDEALDTTSAPGRIAYTVTVAGSQRDIVAVAIGGSAVTLTLSPPVTDGQAVTVSYTVPRTNPVQDAAGNHAAALSNRTVTNNTPDTIAPTLTTAAVNAASLVLTYDEALDTDSTPGRIAYTVTVAGSQRDIVAVAIGGSAVTLTLSPPVTDGQAVTVSYTVPGTNPVQDAAGNDAAALSDQTVTNNTPDTTAPTLTTAAVNAASLVLTYDEALDTDSTPGRIAYTVTVAGSQRDIVAVAIGGSGVTLTLSPPVTDGQAVTVSYTVPGTNPVQDAAGNDVAALSNQTVTNNTPDTPDTTAPTLTTAAVNAASLVLTYDEALDTGSTPATSAYTVTVAGSQRTVSDVAIGGSAVTLTLSLAVTAGQAARVSYTVPGTNPVQDAAGNDVAALSDQIVTNNTPDTTAPTLTTAAVNGASLVLTYNEALDTDSTPGRIAYTVTVAGSQRTVSDVAIGGSAVTLTLSSAVTDGQAVTVSYTAGTNPVRDAARNDAAALSDQTVTNNTPDTTAPTLTMAAVNGASLVLTYDEALDTGSAPARIDYTVTVAGSQRDIVAVAIGGSAVTLTLSSAVTAGQAVTVSYTVPRTNPVQDAAGNHAAALSNQTVTNNTADTTNTPDTTAPTLTMAAVNGASLVLTYNEALDTGSTPATSDYTVTVAGSQRTVSDVAIGGSAVTLTLSPPVTDGQAVTVSYTVPHTNPVQDAAGNHAAALSNRTVTNNTTPDTTAPTLTMAAVNGASLVLTYDEALDTGSTPATSDYTVTVAGSQRTVSDVAIGGSAVTLTLSSPVTDGEAVTVSYTAGTNPVQDAAGNGAAALSNQTVDATVPVPALPGVAVLLLAALLVLVANRLGQSGKVGTLTA